MFHEEKTFNLRFSLEAHFPENYEGDEDAYAWLRDWETRVKPDLLKTIFSSLREYASGAAHVRNRGVASTEEVEIVMVKVFPSGSTS